MKIELQSKDKEEGILQLESKKKEKRKLNRVTTGVFKRFPKL